MHTHRALGTTITVRDLSFSALEAFKGHNVDTYLAQLYYFHVVGTYPTRYSSRSECATRHTAGVVCAP